MIRAVSPRRGSHHHSAPWALGQYLQSEMVPLGQRSRSHADMETDQRKGSTQTTSHVPGDSLHSSQDPHSAHQGLFSHLPLHSQQQVRTPFPMIPIGGIQMVHSVPSSMTGLAHSARLPLQKSTSEESGTSEVSFHLQEGGGGRGPPEDPPGRRRSRPPPRWLRWPGRWAVRPGSPGRRDGHRGPREQAGREHTDLHEGYRLPQDRLGRPAREAPPPPGPHLTPVLQRARRFTFSTLVALRSGSRWLAPRSPPWTPPLKRTSSPHQSPCRQATPLSAVQVPMREC
ncbi:hypothetical protein ANANG_G00116680 [Anguilla anguilla]|uniref:Uncharacterized protein n=1 Tax=Anguilla anguilla TaxID=7936 RepID=A0A9D3RX96_ANGAN|nr:hypothetical protein ANANG_G00116680 [Anguilla anguilla]